MLQAKSKHAINVRFFKILETVIAPVGLLRDDFHRWIQLSQGRNQGLPEFSEQIGQGWFTVQVIHSVIESKSIRTIVEFTILVWIHEVREQRNVVIQDFWTFQIRRCDINHFAIKAIQ